MILTKSVFLEKIYAENWRGEESLQIKHSYPVNK